MYVVTLAVDLINPVCRLRPSEFFGHTALRREGLQLVTSKLKTLMVTKYAEPIYTLLF